jgi:hypothetical protein
MASLNNDGLKTETKKEQSALDKYRAKKQKKNQKEVKYVAKTIDLTENKVYTILEDSTIPFDERMEKIVEMLTIDLSSKEAVDASQENITYVKQIVKELLNRFTAHNRKSIEFTRDNPLNQLKESMQEVFDNYHKISEGRADLKGKLGTVDELIRDMGGEDKLVVALLESKTREAEKAAKETALAAAEAATRAQKIEHNELNRNLITAQAEETSQKSRFLAALRPGVQAEIKVQQKRKLELNKELAESEQQIADTVAAEETARAELLKLTQSEDYQIHAQIVEILDIASPEFKQQLTDLAEQTLRYIDDTQNVMTQVRDQLEQLMEDVDNGLDVNVNIREQVAILSKALVAASDVSAKKLSAFKATNKEDTSALAQLENDKIARAGDIFVSEATSTMSSVTMISSEVQKIEVVLLALRDQLSDGLSDADEQLLMATTTASASGMVMLNRAQTLGTLAQAVISKGQYMTEAEETFGQLTNEFERSLAVKAGRNETIANLTSVIADITEAMDDKNSVAIDIAVEKRELIQDLNAHIDDLRKVAEEARQVESEVNEQLAANVADDAQ